MPIRKPNPCQGLKINPALTLSDGSCLVCGSPWTKETDYQHVERCKPAIEAAYALLAQASLPEEGTFSIVLRCRVEDVPLVRVRAKISSIDIETDR